MSYGLEPETVSGVVSGARVYGVRARGYDRSCGWSQSLWCKILVSAPVPLELIGPLTGLDWVGAGPRGFGDKGFGTRA